jgi:hypothetical protein
VHEHADIGRKGKNKNHGSDEDRHKHRGLSALIPNAKHALF